MKINLKCWFRGHELVATEPEFQEQKGRIGITGLPVSSYKVRIHDGFISCKRPGCSYHQRLYDSDRAADVIRSNKYSETFWTSRFWRNVVDFWETFFPIAVVLFIVGFFLWLIFYLPSVKSCSAYQTEFGIKTVWNFWTGCMAHSDKFGWIPIDKFFQIINLNIP